MQREGTFVWEKKRDSKQIQGLCAKSNHTVRSNRNREHGIEENTPINNCSQNNQFSSRWPL